VSVSIAEASAASITQSIQPATIGLDETARLTIAASGTNAAQITPPMVAGLEFVAVGEAQRLESINGVTTSTTSVTYQVIPRAAGVYTIPGGVAGAAPVVLTVSAGPAGNSAGHRIAGAPAPPASGALPAGRPEWNADGSAYVRLHLPKHELYVGESIPIDIEVGMRAGFVASLNGLPTLNGDEFTLNKLSSEPQRTDEVIDGKSFTVVTWHSVLAAVKPGTFAVTVETPLTVRMRTRTSGAGLFGDAGMADLFNDPMIQNFFGTTTEKEITVTSKPAEFSVLALPGDQPADFSGAVGHFSVSSDLSEDKAAAGDPLTLRMRISGTGNFDRVTSPMLQDVAHWKTYAPTSKFQPSDSIGYRGVKTIEQPVIAMQPGAQSLPPLHFSWFDPDSRQYVQARTSPLLVDIGPPPNGGSVAQLMKPPAGPGTPPANNPADGLRADQLVSGGSTASLTPYYYQPKYLGAPSALLLAFSGAWFWLRRREQAAAAAVTDGGRQSLDPLPLLKVMDEAMAAGAAEPFFRSAHAALQRDLASKWQLPPEAITLQEVELRLGTDSDVARLFMLADEAAYAGTRLTALEFRRWKQVVLDQLHSEVVS
jgi:hypothetical protein